MGTFMILEILRDLWNQSKALIKELPWRYIWKFEKKCH